VYGQKSSTPVDDTPPLGVAYNSLTVGIPKETYALEKRVAATPESVARLVAPGFSVVVEEGAGRNSFFSNADYEAAGAKIVPSIWTESDIVLKVRRTNRATDSPQRNPDGGLCGRTGSNSQTYSIIFAAPPTYS
jgi:NAD/NADP transhydrogenase alpha subunit